MEPTINSDELLRKIGFLNNIYMGDDNKTNNFSKAFRSALFKERERIFMEMHPDAKELDREDLFSQPLKKHINHKESSMISSLITAFNFDPSLSFIQAAPYLKEAVSRAAFAIHETMNDLKKMFEDKLTAESELIKNHLVHEMYLNMYFTCIYLSFLSGSVVGDYMLVLYKNKGIKETTLEEAQGEAKISEEKRKKLIEIINKIDNEADERHLKIYSATSIMRKFMLPSFMGVIYSFLDEDELVSKNFKKEMEKRKNSSDPENYEPDFTEASSYIYDLVHNKLNRITLDNVEYFYSISSDYNITEDGIVVKEKSALNADQIEKNYRDFIKYIMAKHKPKDSGLFSVTFGSFFMLGLSLMFFTELETKNIPLP